MRQLLLSELPGTDGTIRLSATEQHYLFRVRRMRDGQRLQVRLPDSRIFAARVAHLNGERLLVLEEDLGDRGANPPADFASQNSRLQIPPSGQPSIRLLLGYPKGKKLDQSIRQACELGVAQIIPLLCERSVPDPEAASWAKKKQRLQTIISEAAQQSGASPALLGDPIAPAAFVAGLAEPGAAARTQGELVLDKEGDSEVASRNHPKTRAFYFHESAFGGPGLHEYLHTTPDDVVVCIGPEGGFSPAETALFDAAGFAPIWLGPTVLRCETAVVAALSSVLLVLREADSWRTPGL